MAGETGAGPEEGRRYSAPADRNTGPILEVLRDILPESGLILEIASGTGQHAVAFARALSGIVWQPSDRDPALRRSVETRLIEAGLENLRPPVDLDVLQQPWPVTRADAVVCINMIHISPWATTEALFCGAARILPAGGRVFLYGPYFRHGVHTAPSNAAFDADLRGRDPAWGLRDVEAVTDVARSHCFRLDRIVEMPANNLSLVFAADRE